MRKEKTGEMMCKMLTRSTLTASSQAMVATIFIIVIILIFIKIQKIVFSEGGEVGGQLQ